MIYEAKLISISWLQFLIPIWETLINKNGKTPDNCLTTVLESFYIKSKNKYNTQGESDNMNENKTNINWGIGI